MAFYLDFNGTSNKVEFPSGLTLSNVGDYLELDIELNPADDTQFILGNKSNSFNQFLIYDTTRWRLRVFSGIAEVTTSLPSGRATLRFERTSTGYELFYDGISQGTFSQPAGFSPTLLGAWAGGSGFADIDVYGVIRGSSSSELNNYNKQTLSGSNDTVFPDTVGSNTGTLVNFPTDNSQWVFFDDGGGTATLDANVTLPSLTATGNASATLPQPTLSASINLTQLSATGSASATLPNPQLSANVTLSSLTAAGSVSATLPQPTLSANVTLPTITVSGNASATLPGFNLSGNVTLPAITVTGAAQATLPQPTLAASVSLPTFTVTGSATATEPSFTLSGNVTLPTLTATGSASATLPQPTLSGNITLPRIQVSGFLVGGEIVITIDASTNITEPTLSTNITEPTLSTNISE